MIDWHSHILPKLDDGSEDLKQSLDMLAMLAEQGVQRVVATPHFRANKEAVDAFLQRRGHAYNELCDKMDEALPKILQGAEVEFYNGISRLCGLEGLCIDNTNLILIEMPLSRWTEYTVRELEELAATKNVTVVLAHIERYFSKNSMKVFKRLYKNGILMQVSADCFNGLFSRRKAFSLLEWGAVRFIGTDCHNTTTRPPNMSVAVEQITRKYGSTFLERLNEYGISVLENNI